MPAALEMAEVGAPPIPRSAQIFNAASRIAFCLSPLLGRANRILLNFGYFECLLTQKLTLSCFRCKNRFPIGIELSRNSRQKRHIRHSSCSEDLSVALNLAGAPHGLQVV